MTTDREKLLRTSKYRNCVTGFPVRVLLTARCPVEGTELVTVGPDDGDVHVEPMVFTRERFDELFKLVERGQ